MWKLWVFLVSIQLSAVLLFRAYVRYLRSSNASRRTSLLSQMADNGEARPKKLVGFFHPFCNAGGGGERVLWTVIASLQRHQPDSVSVVYTGDVEAKPEDIVRKVKSRFDIQLSLSSLHFVFLHSRYLVEDATWPRFTLAGQSLGSMYLVWEAMQKLMPDLYIDTMGFAFTFHVVSWLAGIPVGAYVHYPTISKEMISRVKSRASSYANSEAITSSQVLSIGKLIYYRLFMYYYRLSLKKASFLMVNSSWTKGHIDFILSYSDQYIGALHLLPPFVLLRYLLSTEEAPRVTVVYPPCDTRAISHFPLEGREKVIMSLAQFRPEKNHAAQLYAFSELLRSHPEHSNTSTDPARLLLIGASRNAYDEERIESLQALARALGIDSQVEFVLNASYPVILDWLSRASIGLSTMVDEHFGIGIVECMAAGVIPVTHASGGPLVDIVVPVDGEPTGYLAGTTGEFANALHTVLSLDEADAAAMRLRARTWAVRRFSEDEFWSGWTLSGWHDWI